MQIIDLDLQLIEARTKQFSTHPLAQHPPATHPHALFPLAPYPLAPHQSEPQPVQLDDMVGILSERPRQVPISYWQPGQPIGAPVSNFRQIKYLPLPNAVPDLYKALSGARLDCKRDIHKQLIELGKAAKVWMTVQVEYEPVNPLANKQPF